MRKTPTDDDTCRECGEELESPLEKERGVHFGCTSKNEAAEPIEK